LKVLTVGQFEGIFFVSAIPKGADAATAPVALREFKRFLNFNFAVCKCGLVKQGE